MKLTLWILGAAALVQAVLLFAGLLPARFCESWHGRGVFPLLRSAIGIPASFVPFSLAQLLLALFTLLVVATLIELALRAFGRTESLRLLPWTGLVCLLAVHGFLLGYGWLHAHPPLRDRLALGPATQDQVESTARELSAAAPGLDVPAAREAMRWSELGRLAHEAVGRACRELDVPGPPPLRLKHPWPDAFLMRFGVSGVFSPFTFEPHVDAGLHHAIQPFIACHELAHVAGIASESEANFVAWLACSHSPDPRFRLAAVLGVLGYFERDVGSELREQLRTTQGRSVQMLRHEIARLFRAMEWKPISRVSSQAYDQLLRAHGVESGIRSYGEVTELVAAWRSRSSRD